MRTSKTFENLSSGGNVAHLMVPQFRLNISLKICWQNIRITGFYSEFVYEVIFFVIGYLYTKLISFFCYIKRQYDILPL